MSDEDPAPDLNDLATSLSQLRPATSRLDRDRVMFLAGQAAGDQGASRRSWVWPAVSASLAIAATLLAIVIIHDRTDRDLPQIVVAASQGTLAGAPPVAPVPAVTMVYWRLREAVFDDHWPSPAAERAAETHAGPAPDRRDLLNELLGG